MKLILKFMAVIIGILVVIMIASFVFIKIFISPERIKQAVLPVAEKTLHREVMLDDVQISIFSGIELSGLKIMNAAGDKPFAACTEARLHYELLPLLDGKVVINEVSLHGPEINITRNKDGSFNFSDILAGSKSKASGEVQAAQEPTAYAKTPQAGNTEKNKNKLAILVSNISITDGKITFTDMAAPGGGNAQVVITDADLKVQDFSPISPFPVKFSARLNGGKIVSQGMVQLPGASIDMDISVNDLDLTGLRPYFAASLPGTLKKAALNSRLKVKFKPVLLDATGNIRLTDVYFVPAAKPDASLNGVSLGIVFTASLDQNSGILILKDTDLDINGIKLTAAGRITGLSTAPAIDMKLGLPAQKLSVLIAAVPPAYAEQAKAFSPSGTIAAAAELKGNTVKGAKILKSASINLDQVTAVINGIPASVNGSLLLEGDRIKSKNIVIKAKDSSMATSIEAENIFGRPIILKTAMNSGNINMDSILASQKPNDTAQAPKPQEMTAKAGSEEQSSKTTEPAGREPEAMHLPLDATGTVAVSQLIYHNIQIKEIDIHYSLKENKLHIVQKAVAAGGNISKDVNIDLGVKGYRYNGTFDIEHAKAKEIMAFAAPSFSDTFYGTLDLEGTFRGSGVLPEDIKKNIWLQGKWKMTDAKLGEGKIVSGLTAFLKLDKELKDIEFSNADGNFRIEKGKVIFAGKFDSEKVRFAPEGDVSLNGDLDIRLNATLSPDLATKLPTGKFMSLMQDKQGWTILPVMITGTCTSPGFGLDTAAVKEKLQEKALQHLTDQLFKKKDKDKKQNSGTTDTQDGKRDRNKNKESDALEHAIRGLFGN